MVVVEMVVVEGGRWWKVGDGGDGDGGRWAMVEGGRWWKVGDGGRWAMVEGGRW